ncbi:MAG: hypothetical protein DRG78_06750 [Epsilonproteobacteria bacterium]|nr:MAG: hypothetical protein DRG78_06750 [Campylobacterota bacterium]
MLNNLSELYTDIIHELKNNNIDIDNCNDLDKILIIIFYIASTNEYSFLISREVYGRCKIVLFNNKDLDTKELFINHIKQESTLSYKFKSKLHNIKYNILKAIKIIPIIGPDGVGKTTLIEKVMEKIDEVIVYKRFKKIVRRSIIYNILHPINKTILKKRYGKKLEKDQHDDLNPKLIIVAGLIYYPYLIFITLFKRKIVFIDRFFNDILLENISFMDKTTHLRYKWDILLIFIPRVFCLIHLDAKTNIIMQRKDELSSDDIDKYRKLNFKIYLKKPAMIYSYINTGNEIDICKNTLLNTLDKYNIISAVQR